MKDHVPLYCRLTVKTPVATLEWDFCELRLLAMWCSKSEAEVGYLQFPCLRRASCVLESWCESKLIKWCSSCLSSAGFDRVRERHARQKERKSEKQMKNRIKQDKKDQMEPRPILGNTARRNSKSDTGRQREE